MVVMSAGTHLDTGLVRNAVHLQVPLRLLRVPPVLVLRVPPVLVLRLHRVRVVPQVLVPCRAPPVRVPLPVHLVRVPPQVPVENVDLVRVPHHLHIRVRCAVVDDNFII